MTAQGSPPHDWAQWISAANEQGLNILRGLTGAMGPGADAGSAAPVFVEAWQQALNDGADPEATADRFNRLVEEALAQGRSGTEAYVAMIETAATALHQLRSWQSRSAATDGGDLFAAFFRLPMVGPLRDRGEAAARVRETLRRYARAVADCQSQLTGAVEAALNAFNDALRERQRNDAFPSSFSGLHALWIASAEPAYEAVLSSETFTSAFSEYQNAAGELMNLIQRELAPLLAALNLPSRQELAGVQRRLHALRREQAQTAALQSEVKALRSELATLRAELQSARSRDGSTG